MSEKDAASTCTWLTVSQAAAARGISERTLRKRIKAGEIEAEKRAQVGGGVAWCVAPLATETEAERKRDGSETENRTGSEPEAERKAFKHEMPTGRKRNGSETEVSDPRNGNRTGSGTGSGTEAERIAEMRGEIQFLRGVVEAQNRDAAEMRATMRALVAAMPKALTSGSPQVLAADESGPKLEEVGTDLKADETTPQVLAVPTQNAPERADGPQIGAAGKVTAESQSGRNAQRTAWQRMAARILGIR